MRLHVGFGRMVVWALLLASPACAWALDLLVSNQSSDSVWRLSTRDGSRRGEHRTGDSPHQLAFDPQRKLAVVSNYGGLQAGNSLSLLDLDGGAPTRRLDLGTHVAPHDVRFLPGGDVLVTAEGSASLVRIDTRNGEIRQVFDIGEGTGHMLEVDPAGRVAWVSKIAKGTITRIDLATGRKIERVAGRGAEGLALRPGGNELWVANRDEGTITVHDPATLAVRRRMSSRGFPLRVAFSDDGRQAFVINARIAELQVFDAGTKLPGARVALNPRNLPLHDTALGAGVWPLGIAVDSARSRIYVAISGADRIAVIDMRTWNVIDYWVTGREPGALLLVPQA